MKEEYLLLLTCCIIEYSMCGSNIQSDRKVLSERGWRKPIMGATVMVKGTNIGTVTDADGLFFFFFF